MAEYRGKPITSRERTLFFVPASMVSLAMLAVGLWNYFYGYENFGPAAALSWSTTWLILALFISLLLLIVLTLRLLLASGYFALYDIGVVVRSNLCKKRLISWSMIEGIAVSTTREHFFGNRIRDKHLAVLATKKKHPIIIDWRLEDHIDLIESIKKMLYPKLLPELKKSLNSGRTISFGKIAINQRGISLRRSFTPWEQVTRVYLQSGFLVVELHPIGKRRLPIKNIFNLEILLYLIDEHIEP
ncbi:MAG: hypothetical protein IBX69_01010 [Anaerolineales bacterium]|nr:hypothetical protein [Anaerolineales bacterium]